jgi:hypothetical protein
MNRAFRKPKAEQRHRNRQVLSFEKANDKGCDANDQKPNAKYQLDELRVG